MQDGVARASYKDVDGTKKPFLQLAISGSCFCQVGFSAHALTAHVMLHGRLRETLMPHWRSS
jgi:hypothetical protein